MSKEWQGLKTKLKTKKPTSNTEERNYKNYQDMILEHWIEGDSEWWNTDD